MRLRGNNILPGMIAGSLFLAFTFLFGNSVMSQSIQDTQTRNKAAVEAKFKAWADGTGNPFELLADGASWTIVGNSAASKTYPDRESFMREVIRPFNARMKVGLKPTIRNIYAEGDTVIVFFDAKGVARDDRPYANTYAWFLEMRDGLVVKAHAFYDSVEFNDFWARVKPVY